jgi:TolB-like protein
MQFGHSTDFDADLAAARQHCETAGALNPESPDAQAQLALIEWAEHDFDSAVARMERAVALGPNHSLALGLAGLMSSFIGDAQTAVDLMLRAARLTPATNNWYPFPLAQGYLRLGRYAEAHTAISEFIARGLRTERGTTLLIASLAGLDRMPEAVAFRDEMTAEFPAYSIAWVRGISDRIIPYNAEAFAPIAALLRKAGVPEEPPAPPRPGIAVLPFDNMSDDAAQDYFADGLTETLITNLSRLDGLMVIARNSAFVFKGRAVDVREVGETLGVDYVVEGSEQILGERVRVNAQLVDAASGGHLWAESYDREMKDIFAVHDDISERIVAALDVTLSEGDADRLTEVETQSVEAYDSYIRGLAELFRYTPEASLLGESLMHKAVEIDPGYARPYSMLGLSMFVAWEFQWRPEPDVLAQATALTRKGVDIDPNLATAHAVLGWLLLWQGQYDAAIAALEKAVAIDPDDIWAVTLLAETYNYIGRPQEVPPLFPILERIDPLYPLNDFYLGHAQYLMGDYDAAVASLNKTLTFAPNFLPAQRILAAIHAEHGRVTEAQGAVEEVRRISPSASVALWRERLPYRDPSVTERLIESWQKAENSGESE